MVGWVGNGHEQQIATLHQRQRAMLAYQLLADGVFWLLFLVDDAQIQQGHAELLGGQLGNGACLDQLVLYQMTDQRNLVALGICQRLLGHLGVQQLRHHQLPRQAAERDGGVHDRGKPDRDECCIDYRALPPMPIAASVTLHATGVT